MIRRKKKEWSPGKVPNASSVFKNIGKKAFEREWYETAIKIFDIAEKVTESHKEKLPLCTYKSEAHRALANMEESRYEAMKAMSYSSAGEVTPYLNMAHLLYHENEFEDSVSKFIKGIKSKNPAFKRGVNMAIGILNECVGHGAGDMFDKEVLGKSVVRIKQEEMGLAPPVKKLNNEDQLVRNLNLNKRKRYLAGRYLHEVAAEKEFLENLTENEILKLGPQNIVDKLSDIVETTIDNVDLKQDALWHRKPLYSYYSQVKNFQTSQYARKFEAHRKRTDKAMLNKSVVKQIKELYNLSGKGECSECYQKMMRLKKRLNFIFVKQLPLKFEYIGYISEIMGKMYLATKTFLPNISQELNDLRIKRTLGVVRTFWPHPIEEVDHVYLKNPNAIKEYFLNELKHSESHLEKIFLNYEIASIIAMHPETGAEMRKYCYAAFALAKKVRSITWYLNSLFIISKAEFTDGRLHEGTLTLLAAMKACLNCNKIEQAKFIDRALLLLQHLKPEDFTKRKNVLVEEKKLINLMPDEELKKSAVSKILSLSEIPVWRRMSLPGAGSVKQRIQEIKNLRPLPVEKICDDNVFTPKVENWVTGLDDNKPYSVENILSKEEKAAMVQTIFNEPRYRQFLTIEGEAKDYVMETF